MRGSLRINRTDTRRSSGANETDFFFLSESSERWPHANEESAELEDFNADAPGADEDTARWLSRLLPSLVRSDDFELPLTAADMDMRPDPAEDEEVDEERSTPSPPAEGCLAVMLSTNFALGVGVSENERAIFLLFALAEEVGLGASAEKNIVSTLAAAGLVADGGALLLAMGAERLEEEEEEAEDLDGLT
jgi:hypothetical protein